MHFLCKLLVGYSYSVHPSSPPPPLHRALSSLSLPVLLPFNLLSAVSRRASLPPPAATAGNRVAAVKQTSIAEEQRFLYGAWPVSPLRETSATATEVEVTTEKKQERDMERKHESKDERNDEGALKGGAARAIVLAALRQKRRNGTQPRKDDDDDVHRLLI